MAVVSPCSMNTSTQSCMTNILPVSLSLSVWTHHKTSWSCSWNSDQNWSQNCQGHFFAPCAVLSSQISFKMHKGSSYRQQTKLHKGNVLCQEFCSGVSNRHPLQATSPGRHPPPRQTSHQQTATAADGTHSSGMHSCYCPQTKFAKVMFLRVSVCPQRGGAWFFLGGMLGFFQGACVVFAGGHACFFQRGHAWFFLGVCVVFSRGHAWFFLGGHA